MLSTSVQLGAIIYWVILFIVLFLVYRDCISNIRAIIFSIVVSRIFTFLTIYPLDLKTINLFNIIYPVQGYDPFYIFIYACFVPLILVFPFSLIIYYIYDFKITIQIGIITFLILYFAVIITLLIP